MTKTSDLDAWEGERCLKCGRPVMPMGAVMMPIEGLCECVFFQ